MAPSVGGRGRLGAPAASLPSRGQATWHLPLSTRDTDLAVSPEALTGNLRTALTDAGFIEELFGNDAPPAAHYRLGEDDAGFYAEFLTPLHGSGLKRDGKPDATMSKAGITAQQMRYLELLLVSPWSVRVGPDRE